MPDTLINPLLRKILVTYISEELRWNEFFNPMDYSGNNSMFIIYLDGSCFNESEFIALLLDFLVQEDLELHICVFAAELLPTRRPLLKYIHENRFGTPLKQDKNKYNITLYCKSFIFLWYGDL